MRVSAALLPTQGLAPAAYTVNLWPRGGAGDNSQLFSPLTGWPAVQVPMGYTRGVLPAGLTLFGRAWSEPTLLRFAYAYEQATWHRRPPASAPPLR